ncbi:MAG: hypothetical protein ACON39_03945 [Coraliomargaritaceae bacterium]
MITGGDGQWESRLDGPPVRVPRMGIAHEPRIEIAWWVSDDGAKAALRPVRGMLDSIPEAEEAGYLDYNENSLHAARMRQDRVFDYPLLYDGSESAFLGKIETAISTGQVDLLAGRLTEAEQRRVASELHRSVCLENRFVLSNALEGGLQRDLSYVKRLPAAGLSDETLRGLYEDRDDLLRVDAARLIQHRGEPSAKRTTRANAKMLLPTDSAEEAAERFAYFSLAPVVTELQLVLALAATPREGGTSGASNTLHLVHQLTLELWNPYTVPFLLGEAGAGGPPGHCDVRLVIRNLPNYVLSRAVGGGTLASGALPEIDLLWSRDSGIRRYRKLLRPGMVYRKSIPAATARREVRTIELVDRRVNANDRLTGSFAFGSNRPVEIELYGIDGSGEESSFFKAKIRGYEGFTKEYLPASRGSNKGLLFAPPLKRKSLLEDNPNAFAIGFRLLDKQSPRDGSEDYSQLLSRYEVRRPLLKIDLDALDPDDPWSGDSPLPFDCRTDGQGHDPSKYRFGQAFAPSDVFHYNEKSVLGGRKDRIARAFDFPIGEVVDVGIFRTLQFRDHPSNAVGNPWGGVLNRVYDRYFFSTLPDPDRAKWDGSRALANARIRGYGGTPQLENPDTASQLLLYNGFNLNAASALAWEKVLHGQSYAPGQLRIAYEKPNGAQQWQALEPRVERAYANFPQTALFNQSEQATDGSYELALRREINGYAERFSTHSAELFEDRQHPALRQTIRELLPIEIESLADAIVASLQDFVKENGRPPLSLAEYLNAGILQRAIDATPSINQRIDKYDGIPRHGAASITQATLMNALGPLAFVRSDSFTIRAYAQVDDSAHGIAATALCQAQVQRIPEAMNDGFGRRMIVHSFQWLDPKLARL